MSSQAMKKGDKLARKIERKQAKARKKSARAAARKDEKLAKVMRAIDAKAR